MKRYFTLLGIAVVFVSCQRPEDQINDFVSHHPKPIVARLYDTPTAGRTHTLQAADGQVLIVSDSFFMLADTIK